MNFETGQMAGEPTVRELLQRLPAIGVGHVGRRARGCPGLRTRRSAQGSARAPRAATPENGANSSFVNRFLDDQIPVADVVRDPMAVVTAYDAALRPKIALPRDLYGAEREDTAGLALGGAFPVWEATPACAAFTGSTATGQDHPAHARGQGWSIVPLIATAGPRAGGPRSRVVPGMQSTLRSVDAPYFRTASGSPRALALESPAARRESTVPL